MIGMRDRTAFGVWFAMRILGLLVCLSLSSLLDAESVRMVCWNIHHGVGEDGRLDLERIAAVIQAEKPDVVALQEVDQSCGRSGRVDQAKELARLLGMRDVFGKAMDFDGGAYGLAVLSKLPIASHKVHRLPGGAEPRIALEVRLVHPAGEFALVNVHLDHHGEGRRLRQAEHLKQQLVGRDSIVLCGDFNALPDSQTMQVFSEWKTVGKVGPRLTQPAGAPRVEIDHVLLRGLEAKAGVKVIEEKVASDHRPLVWTVSRQVP